MRNTYRPLFIAVAFGGIAIAASILVIAQEVSPEDRLVKRELGDVLLSLDDDGLLLTVKRTTTGDVASVQLVSREAGAVFEYQPKGPYGVPAATYSDCSPLAAPNHIRWFDLNGDGVFDQRVIVGEYKQLKASTGAQILVGGAWLKGARVDSTSGSPFLVEGVPHSFDPKLGTWKPENPERR